MPNYLQRILTSGARSTSFAKPPASSRAVIPPISPSVYLPMTEISQQVSEGFSDTASRHVASEESVPGSAHALAAPKKKSESSTDSRHEELTHESDVNRDTNRGVVPSHSAPAMSLAIPHPYPSTVGARIRAPKGLRRTDGDRERKYEIVHAVGETLRAAISPSAGTQFESKKVPTSVEPPSTVSSKQSQVSPDASVQLHPRSVGTTAMPRATSSLPEKVSADESTSRNGEAGAQPEMTVPGNVLSSSERQSVEVKSSVRNAPVEMNLLSPTRVIEDRKTSEADHFGIQPGVPRQTSQSAVVGTSEKRRRSQISIGRIDVQVNNLPAQQVTNPQPARQPTQSNFLDVRYLNRFFLKI